jgi:hypothetical protein
LAEGFERKYAPVGRWCEMGLKIELALLTALACVRLGLAWAAGQVVFIGIFSALAALAAIQVFRSASS